MQQLLFTDCIPTVYSVLDQNISHKVIAVGKNTQVPQRRFHALAQDLLTPAAAVMPHLELPICLGALWAKMLSNPSTPGQHLPAGYAGALSCPNAWPPAPKP